MREIKYRGKSIETGEWIYGYYVYTHDRHRIIYEDYEGFYCEEEVDPETVGQYISLKDKNSKEIYEGDIIEEYDDGVYHWVVKWDNECACFYLHEQNIGETFYLDDLVSVVSKGKVIGNIHEHPHLLKIEN